MIPKSILKELEGIKIQSQIYCILITICFLLSILLPIFALFNSVCSFLTSLLEVG